MSDLSDLSAANTVAYWRARAEAAEAQIVNLSHRLKAYEFTPDPAIPGLDRAAQRVIACLVKHHPRAVPVALLEDAIFHDRAKPASAYTRVRVATVAARDWLAREQTECRIPPARESCYEIAGAPERIAALKQRFAK